MRRSIRLAGIIVCLAIALSVVFPVSASAANTDIIDVSNASAGYFTVNYSGTTARMKVGTTFNGTTEFADYTAGTASRFAFAKGNGSYSISLYENVGGISYKRIASVDVTVSMESANTQNLVSTAEITFEEGDAVSSKAAELCEGLSSDEEKIVAIYTFMLSFSYDYDLADQIIRGEIVGYTPDTEEVLESEEGICYGLSALFAAMCRSQGIACRLVKGTYAGGAHAWNEVLCGGTWYRVDMTYTALYKNSASCVEECVSPLTRYAA